MRLIVKLICLLYFLIPVVLSGQSFIHVQGSFNYWNHTELFGPGVGLGYSYQFDQFSVTVNYDFGYGAINRLDEFDNVDYDNWTTVFLKTDRGKWNDYLGFTSSFSNDLQGGSDYGKQHQLSVQFGYHIKTKNDFKVIFKTGIFSAIVEHFYTYKNIPIHYIRLPSVYSGELNYIPTTTQRILTYGVNFEMALEKDKVGKTWAPYIVVGIGPGFGSYAGAGLRLSTMLIRKST